MRVSHLGLTAVVASALVLSGGVAANAADVSGDPLAAVIAATPGTVAQAADVATNDAGTNAVASTVGGTAVTVPVDPSAGISLGTGANAVSIGLPFAQKADDATVEKPGVVSYDNNNGSTTVPVVQNDGTVQINTVIQVASAPTRYEYPINIPAGEFLQLNADGSVYVASEEGAVSTYLAAPWAKDAKGKLVPTHYEVVGDTLTQVVEHRKGDAYPVVADPKFEWYWGLPSVKTTRTETAALMTLATAGKMCGQVGKVAGGAGIVLCVANLASIIVNAQRAYWAGKCSQLLFGPGVVGTVAYKDSYCR